MLTHWLRVKTNKIKIEIHDIKVDKLIVLLPSNTAEEMITNNTQTNC